MNLAGLSPDAARCAIKGLIDNYVADIERAARSVLAVDYADLDPDVADGIVDTVMVPIRASAAGVYERACELVKQHGIASRH